MPTEMQGDTDSVMGPAPSQVLAAGERQLALTVERAVMAARASRLACEVEGVERPRKPLAMLDAVGFEEDGL